MSTSNRKKAQQLGMSFGKASHELRRAMTLHLLQKLGEDSCYRCGKKIERPEDLSMDHKIDWLDNDPKLFWDVLNVAYSHKWCNKTGRRERPTLRVVGPAGTSWCTRCKEHKPIAQFQKCARRWNGLDDSCKECKAKRNKQLRLAKAV